MCIEFPQSRSNIDLKCFYRYGIDDAMADQDAEFTVTLRDVNNNPTRVSDGQVVDIISKKVINCRDIGFWYISLYI